MCERQWLVLFSVYAVLRMVHWFTEILFLNSYFGYLLSGFASNTERVFFINFYVSVCAYAFVRLSRVDLEQKSCVS